MIARAMVYPGNMPGKDTAPTQRLIADCMLGRLARWLRILGFDVVYDAHLGDGELVERAVAEQRVILTRDRRLVLRRRARRYLLIDSERLDEQLAQVLRELRLAVDPGGLFGRCLVCNQPLIDLPADEARGRVPPYVAETQTDFRRCPRCERVYWAATHVHRMLGRLARMGIAVG